MSEIDSVVVAFVGCLHGELNRLYRDLETYEEDSKQKIDLVVCCGDFQATRDMDDLRSMVVSKKFRKMHEFHEYYSGSLESKYLTIFIGGNHEAANHLWELPYGGWVAPNIYYMGYSNVVTFYGYTIGGISGIFKSYDYQRGHDEFPPFDESSLRSFYHTRKFDVMKMMSMEHLDVFISHDWPCPIWEHGDVDKLVSDRPYFKSDVENNRMGNPNYLALINKLKPDYYFAAHMHYQFAARVEHENSCTEFLSLDKALPRRSYFKVVNLGKRKNFDGLKYNIDWLALTKLYHPWITSCKLPPPDLEVSIELLIDVKMRFLDLTIYGSHLENGINDFLAISKSENGVNNNTAHFCDQLGIDNPCISKESIFNASITGEMDFTKNIV